MCLPFPWLQPHLQVIPCPDPQDRWITATLQCWHRVGQSQNLDGVLRRRRMGSLSANKLNTYGPCGSHPEATLTHQPLVPLPPPPPGTASFHLAGLPEERGGQVKAPLLLHPPAYRCVRQKLHFSIGAPAAPTHKAASSRTGSGARQDRTRRQ